MTTRTTATRRRRPRPLPPPPDPQAPSAASQAFDNVDLNPQRRDLTSTWEPGDPLFYNPHDDDAPRSVIVSGYSRQLFSLLDNSINFSFEEDTLVRVCTKCEVLWASDTRCWACGGYARPPRFIRVPGVPPRTFRSPTEWRAKVFRILGMYGMSREVPHPVTDRMHSSAQPTPPPPPPTP